MAAPLDMQVDLRGRTALVTGGSKGLGFESARRLALNGAGVALLARGSQDLESACAAIQQEAPAARLVPVVCDVASSADLERAWRQAREALGPIDILLNNAGGHALGSFMELTDEAWTRDLDLKLMAHIRLTRLCWPDMAQRRWGRVINTLNTLARAPGAGSGPTSVTRAAQLALTKVLSKEGAPHNILVNALLVGLIRSDQLTRYQQQADAGHAPDRYSPERVAQRVPLGRMGEPREFANLACFLASDAGSYITGAAINVDGGMSPVP